MATRLAVIYYSATGSVHALAEAVADGARSSGAEVRLRRVPELAGEEAIDWGCLLVAPGYSDPVLFAAGGNPYGTSSGGNDGAPSPAVLVAARYQGRLVADVANRLGAGVLAASAEGDAA